MTKKILIIGANGFTGRRILTDLAARNCYDLAASSLHADIAPGDNYRFVTLDISDIKGMEALMKDFRPDAVINTSALSAPDYCETHREEAYLINVESVEKLAQLCETYQSRFIQLSTDFVFDEVTDELYKEEDAPHPLNYYGVTKLESEAKVAQYCSNYAIARIVVVYGRHLPGQHGNIVQLVANKLTNGESINVVSDQWRTPTFVGDVAQGIEKLVNHTHNGIYHICGKDCLSIADMAYRVADYLKLDKNLINPLSTAEMNEATPRPRHSGLSIEKAIRELDYHPHSFEEGLKEMFG